MSRPGTKAPIVFRIHDEVLRQRMEALAKDEVERTGYRIGVQDIAERAIRELLARQEERRARLTKAGGER